VAQAFRRRRGGLARGGQHNLAIELLAPARHVGLQLLALDADSFDQAWPVMVGHWLGPGRG